MVSKTKLLVVLVVIVSLAFSACAVSPAAPTPLPPTLTPVPPTPTPVPPTVTPTPTPTLAIGSTRVREKDGMEMVYVPSGTFQMGSNDGHDEQPVHSVALHSFWIDQTEVTNAEYARCVAAGMCTPPSSPISATRDSYYGDSQYDDYPVIWVSWNHAATYCEWAGGRLPTEAEWEYAARGPDRSVYPWGDEPPPDETLLNYMNNVGDTTRVGSYPGGASWCGALDLAGNVWEWVNDWYADDYYAASPAENPTGPDSGRTKVRRGGAWSSVPDGVRSARRNDDGPASSYRIIGFRCVVAATSSR